MTEKESKKKEKLKDEKEPRRHNEGKNDKKEKIKSTQKKKT